MAATVLYLDCGMVIDRCLVYLVCYHVFSLLSCRYTITELLDHSTLILDIPCPVYLVYFLCNLFLCIPTLSTPFVFLGLDSCWFG